MLVFMLLAGVVCTLGAPIDDGVAVNVQPIVEILSKQDVLNADGSFNYSYESANGIKVVESGYIKKNPNPNVSSRLGGEGEEGEDNGDIRVVQGSFSYTAPDGTVITLRYTADENGFHPEGDHLPVAPAIPVEIQRSLDLNAGTQERSGKSLDPPQLVPSQPEQAPSRPELAPSQPEEAPSQPEEAVSLPDQEPSQPDPIAQTPVEN